MRLKPAHPQTPNPSSHRAWRVLCAAGLLSLGAEVWAQSPTPAPRRSIATPKAACVVADFRTLALETHDSGERATKARDWLRTNGSACTAAQLFNLASNRAAWLGVADTPTLMGMIDSMLEKQEASKPAVPSAPANPATPSAALPTTPRAAQATPPAAAPAP